MLPALDGRINRKTYMLGNLIGLGVLGAFCAVIVLPVGILDIALGNSRFGPVIAVMYWAVLLPVMLYAFYFSVLMVKRAHDFNSPGLLWVMGFFLTFIAARLTDVYQLNIVWILIGAFFCIKAGSKTRNNFGPRPRDHFRFRDLKITF